MRKLRTIGFSFLLWLGLLCTRAMATTYSIQSIFNTGPGVYLVILNVPVTGLTQGELVLIQANTNSSFNGTFMVQNPIGSQFEFFAVNGLGGGTGGAVNAPIPTPTPVVTPTATATATPAATPATCTITGTVVRTDGTACVGCNITFRPSATQQFNTGLDVLAIPGYTVTTDAGGNIPSGTQLIQNECVIVQVDRDKPLAVSVPTGGGCPVNLGTLLQSGGAGP